MKYEQADQIGAATFVTPKASRLTVGELLMAHEGELRVEGKLSGLSDVRLLSVFAAQTRTTALELSALFRCISLHCLVPCCSNPCPQNPKYPRLRN